MSRTFITLLSSLALLVFIAGCDTSTDLPTDAGSSDTTDVYRSDSSGIEPTSSEDEGDLSEAEIDGLLFMREEEKLARDVYITLYDIWQDSVFNNISESEQQHMDAMLVLLDSYELQDPALVSVGLFFDSVLQDLYNQLTNRGMQSNIEALMVGAFIEEVDMRDIQHAIDAATHGDIISTYESLLCGSRNHLRAFVKRIENLGVIYQAQVLPQDEVDSIVNSPTEKDCGR